MMAQASRLDEAVDTVVTIGKQHLNVRKPELVSLADEFDADIQELTGKFDCDDVLKRLLGVKSIFSIDVSDYEGCDFVHDMNIPVSDEMHNKFDVLIDGGSLEHIFNVPVALDNYMNLVRPGGSIFIFTVANNHMGHGFYQFSPEFFYRVFEERNGFSVNNMWLEVHPYPGIELSANNRCYRVVDPKVVRGRVGVVSKKLVSILVHAKKADFDSDVDKIQGYTPIQSDYAAMHNEVSNMDNVSIKKRGRMLPVLAHKFLPKLLVNKIRGWRQLREFSFSNKRYFEKL